MVLWRFWDSAYPSMEYGFCMSVMQCAKGRLIKELLGVIQYIVYHAIQSGCMGNPCGGS